MSARAELRAALGLIDPVDAREASSIAATLDRLTWPQDPFDEALSDHHLTGSAFVVSERGVILLRHRLLGIWVQPGGHVDPGEDALAAARRETLEETGLATTPLLERPYHVDVHPGPRGHTHYDLRYLLSAAPEDPSPAPGESPDVHWFDLAAAAARCEPSLVPVLERLARELAGDAWESGS